MNKPTKELNAGQQAAVRAIRGRIRKRKRQYEADKLLEQAYALTEVLGFFDEYVVMASRRKGGVGKK